jgi:hypothetical protein
MRFSPKDVRVDIQSRDQTYSLPCVMPPKLASAIPAESLAIYPSWPTCDQARNYPYKDVRVNVKEGE